MPVVKINNREVIVPDRLLSRDELIELSGVRGRRHKVEYHNVHNIQHYGGTSYKVGFSGVLDEGEFAKLAYESEFKVFAR